MTVQEMLDLVAEADNAIQHYFPDLQGVLADPIVEKLWVVANALEKLEQGLRQFPEEIP